MFIRARMWMIMKNRNIGLGIVLVIVGIIWGLSNTKLLPVNLWAAVLEIWPVFIIGLGITIIAGKKVWLKALTWLTIVVILITYSTLGERGIVEYKKPLSLMLSVNVPESNEEKTYKEPINTDINNGKMKIDLGVRNVVA